MGFVGGLIFGPGIFWVLLETLGINSALYFCPHTTNLRSTSSLEMRSISPPPAAGFLTLDLHNLHNLADPSR